MIQKPSLQLDHNTIISLLECGLSLPGLQTTLGVNNVLPLIVLLTSPRPRLPFTVVSLNTRQHSLLLFGIFLTQIELRLMMTNKLILRMQLMSRLSNWHKLGPKKKSRAIRCLNNGCKVLLVTFLVLNLTTLSVVWVKTATVFVGLNTSTAKFPSLYDNSGTMMLISCISWRLRSTLTAHKSNRPTVGSKTRLVLERSGSVLLQTTCTMIADHVLVDWLR